MSATTTATSQAIFWGLVLIVSIAVLGIFVWRVRRWAFKPAEGSSETVWSLQHLRDLKATGQITDTEFEALKAKMLAGMRRPADGGIDPSPPSRKIDAEKR